MSDLFQQESPLAQIEFVEPEGRAPRIEEKAFNGYLNLRGRPQHTGFVAACLKVLGVEAPTEANTVVDAGERRIYWVSRPRSRPNSRRRSRRCSARWWIIPAA